MRFFIFFPIIRGHGDVADCYDASSAIGKQHKNYFFVLLTDTSLSSVSAYQLNALYEILLPDLLPVINFYEAKT